MNDSTFINYENYYCPTSHQVTDINPLITTTEYDEMPSTIHYINSGSCDMTTPLTQNTVVAANGPLVEQRHQQSNIFSFLGGTHESDHDKLVGECTAKRGNCSGSASGTNVTSSGSVFGSIPFVQIHTTDVQPPRTSYGNVFRRNISKQEEIKSEPIKSENAEASKERTNATPTPPRTSTQTQNENNVNNIDSEVITDKTSSNINKDEKSSPNLQIFKCLKCAFISLGETERDDHVNAQHKDNLNHVQKQRQQINCPGCTNVFYVRESLQIHLKLDHFLPDNDIEKLLNSLIPATANNTENLNKSSGETNKSSNQESSKEPIRKSRIYLKNVECLREPNRQPMEQTDNQLKDSTTLQNLEPAKTNPPKQKISIKSVDVLREPALLRRDYELQNNNINNFLNFNNDLLTNSLDLISTPINLNSNSNTFDFNPNLDNSLNKSNLNNNNLETNLVNNHNPSSVSVEGEKSRRPKIYVKSVESFNLMPLDTLHSNNNSNFLNDHNNSCNTNQVYDTNMVHLPYIFDTNSSSNNINNNAANFINQHNDMDTFQFINTSNTNNSNNNYTLLDNTLFLGSNEDINNVNVEQMENVTLIPNSTTTPTPPSTADVNTMMMNKPISSNATSTTTTQEQRGTLHLRTVDELNLMNKTEVQHLIAPNLDNNNHANETFDKVNSSSLNDINLIGDDLYEDDNFKFHDLDTQMVNDWPETYEDLAEDINCIIADASNENTAEHMNFATVTENNNNNNNQKLSNSNNFDIETPQVSLITIRDIEELTGATNHVVLHNSNNEGIQQQQQNLIVEQTQESHQEGARENEIVSQEPIMVAPETNVNDNNLKRELSNATPETNETSPTTKVTDTSCSNEITTNNKILTTSKELPPLVPVTNTNKDTSNNSLNKSLPSSDIPLPPLVPVSNMIKINSINTNTTTETAKPAPLEKGRIYVANNLMEPPKRPIAVAATSGTSVRGRPFGSNRTRITKLKQTIGSSAEDLFSKCSIKGCAFRFKKPETVEYHRKCHDPSSDSPQAMLCPECKSTEFTNWNTLHTHLWRAHQIDMELYKCELCEFKTPIFSRLVNTHAKIHFDDRNYKCEQCEKAFKNSKQLKNHRRWHRVQAAAAANTTTVTKAPPTEIHRCNDCGSTFSQQKTLREHCCKKGESSLKCSICEKLMSSKSSLKLHLLTHSDGEKRYKCQNCDYATNDHNAFRRHRMGHENRKMYECNFCPYKSVQSVAYQKHVLQKHPEKADSVIHKCSVCNYSTINRSLLVVHQAKHDKSMEDLTKSKVCEDTLVGKSTEKSVNVGGTEVQKSKIKVKSNLFTTNTTIANDSVVNINHNDLNLVQLYNVDAGSVT